MWPDFVKRYNLGEILIVFGKYLGFILFLANFKHTLIILSCECLCCWSNIHWKSSHLVTLLRTKNVVLANVYAIGQIFMEKIILPSGHTAYDQKCCFGKCLCHWANFIENQAIWSHWTVIFIHLLRRSKVAGRAVRPSWRICTWSASAAAPSSEGWSPETYKGQLVS